MKPLNWDQNTKGRKYLNFFSNFFRALVCLSLCILPLSLRASAVTLYFNVAHMPTLSTDSMGNLTLSFAGDFYGLNPSVNPSIPGWSPTFSNPSGSTEIVDISGFTGNLLGAAGATWNQMVLSTSPVNNALVEECYKTLLLTRLTPNLYPFLEITQQGSNTTYGWTNNNNGVVADQANNQYTLSATLNGCGTFIAPISGVTNGD